MNGCERHLQLFRQVARLMCMILMVLEVFKQTLDETDLPRSRSVASICFVILPMLSYQVSTEICLANLHSELS